LFGCEFVELDLLKSQAMYAAKISQVFCTIKQNNYPLFYSIKRGTTKVTKVTKELSWNKN